MYLAQVGGISWPGFLSGFLVPTLLGNIIGGSALVAALNFAQVASERLGEG
jgi:formate-nitrite transporter family protein